MLPRGSLILLLVCFSVFLSANAKNCYWGADTTDMKECNAKTKCNYGCDKILGLCWSGCMKNICKKRAPSLICDKKWCFADREKKWCFLDDGAGGRKECSSAEDCRDYQSNACHGGCSDVPVTSGYKCSFTDGDGSGADEVQISTKITGQECVKACLQLKKRDNTVSGVTIYQNNENGCWCEQGMTSKSGSTTYKTCFLNGHFVKEESNSRACRDGYKKIEDEETCETAANMMGVNYVELVDLDFAPTGCIHSGDFYFNMNGMDQSSELYGPVCKVKVDGCYTGDGSDYRGTANFFTEDDKVYECQPWDLQTPNSHDMNSYTNAGLEGNFCRNPDGGERPWCYNGEGSSPRWGWCDIPQCGETQS